MNKEEKIFASMIILAIILYVLAMISGIPDHEHEVYLERSIGSIMRFLFMTPLFIIIPVGFIASLFSSVKIEYKINDQEYNYITNLLILFVYAIIVLFSSILFFKISLKHPEYQTSAWFFLSSGIILFISTFFHSDWMC